jgi:hypothetical protein
MHAYGPTVNTGDSVRAGRLIAYHEVQPDNPGHAGYEIAMNKADTTALGAHAIKQISMLTLLSPAVASVCPKVGITPANSIWSADFRFDNPCFMKARGLFVGPLNAADTVVLRH